MLQSCRLLRGPLEGRVSYLFCPRRTSVADLTAEDASPPRRVAQIYEAVALESVSLFYLHQSLSDLVSLRVEIRERGRILESRIETPNLVFRTFFVITKLVPTKRDGQLSIQRQRKLLLVVLQI